MEDNAKCFIKIEEGVFEEITYTELEKRRKKNSTYKSKKFIYLYGMLMEVSEDEYKDYHKEKERNRYAKNVLKKLNVVSIEQFKDDDDFPSKDVIEDKNTNIELEVEKKYEIEQLNKALLKLTEDEYKMIKALFYDDIAIRKYANNVGIPFTTIQYQKEKILKKLEKFMKN